MTEFLQFFPSESLGPPELKTLWLTNLWPDETKPHHGSFVYSQARSLWKLGLDVDVLYLRGLLGKRGYFTTLRAVRATVADPRYRLLHAHSGHAGAVAVATRVRRRPLIISYLGDDLLKTPNRRGHTLRSTVEVAAFRRLPYFAAATITKSAEMGRALSPSLRARNFVFPNGVDTDMFSPRSQVESRETLNWPPEGKVALFVGDPDNFRKRADLAQEAMRLVRVKAPDARLEIAAGVKPEMVPIFMNAADCLVFPSRSEGSPNTVKEAMASELPIVATEVGDVRELLDGVDGCFIRQPTPDAFADAILETFRLGRAPAARVAVERLALDTVAGRLRDIYLSVL
jgi:teichuronic acid biosynthesis glycosyltransferase TuaC